MDPRHASFPPTSPQPALDTEIIADMLRGQKLHVPASRDFLAHTACKGAIRIRDRRIVAEWLLEVRMSTSH